MFSCTLDEPDQFYSPESGFLQIFISSDNLDTSIAILGTDYSISDKDSMDLLIYQGKAYDLDSNYAILYNTINAWRQEENVYNILDWNVDSGYRSFEIFETHLPPSEYNLISVGLIVSAQYLDERGSRSSIPIWPRAPVTRIRLSKVSPI